MRNIALSLCYEGTAYHGWQVQKNAVTVAGTLEAAAAKVLGHRVHITGCGRTDAGVHAKRYIANFHTDSRIPAERISYALNTHLPQDIAVWDAWEIHDGFNAIGSCCRKEYTYLLYNTRIRDPFYVNRAWFYPKHLDEGVHAGGGGPICRDPRLRGGPLRRDASQVHGADGATTSTSSARRSYLAVGCAPTASSTIWPGPWRDDASTPLRGNLPPADIAAILEKGDRTAAGPTVPPGGLYLSQLWYDDGKVAFHIGD